MVNMWLDHAHALDDDVMNSILHHIHGGCSVSLLNMVQNRLVTSLASLVVAGAVVLDVVVRLFVDRVIGEMHE